LVGGLRDEFEPPGARTCSTSPTQCLRQRSDLISDANELLGLSWTTPNTTRSAATSGRIGAFRKVGDTVEVDGHRLEVEAMDDRRVERVWSATAALTRRTEADLPDPSPTRRGESHQPTRLKAPLLVGEESRRGRRREGPGRASAAAPNCRSTAQQPLDRYPPLRRSACDPAPGR
jgi:hypothetical protein